ncbi:RDD family protein [Halpernia frigidisoli]|uniref:Uncharacterized membrane protein YckC, RDD family n=1 Tax=Halpernia frigidisoli TaxID=1125876 RepID=A0A1I3D1L6_9FLAO|nr:RDD family protein [Halpernia frigidisoli]SFH80518.1 Uncharacterized membrane protein YckC, RDD family [Halpernia frigidisoli]
MAKILKIVYENKADKGLRFLNYIIDLVFIYVVVIIFFNLVGIVLEIFFPDSVDAIINSFEDNNKIFDRLLSLIFYGLFIFLTEWATNGRSVGKYITGTIAVKNNGKPLSLKDYFLRNISRAIPLDQLSFLGSGGWHDSLTHTSVIVKKKYDAATTLQNDLDNLGK